MTTLVTATRETNCNQEFLVKNIIRSGLLNPNTQGTGPSVRTIEVSTL